MTISDPTLIVVAGPTCVGKTSIAVSLASHFNTEIISADSRQFFREMNIGTAVPSPEERTRVKHHFIHHLSVHDGYNVSRYETEVLERLEELFRKFPVVIMVGGSGLYIDAVCHGIDHLPDPDPEIRSALKELITKSGIGALQAELSKLDPEYSRQADMNNPARLIRALEVCRLTGMPYSSFLTKKPVQRNFRIIKLGIYLDRDQLYKRINERVDFMMKAGLYNEALSLHPVWNMNALNTVGYRELFDYFEGLVTLDYAVDKIKVHTRRYAKRQLTWFKKDPAYNWFRPDDLQGIIGFLQRDADGTPPILQ